MKQYLDFLKHTLQDGVAQADRTGTGTLATFGHQMRFDIADGIPLLTTKKLHLRSIIHELLWFLRGDTNVKYLNDNGVTIWDEWAKDNELGPVYGKQWRDWVTPDGRHLDQISELVRLHREDPNSRRQVVSAWNVGDLAEMALSPCHCLFQTAVIGNKLHLQLYQRSTDIFLGLPYNLMSYSLLLAMLAQQCGLEPGTFVWTGGHNHLYVNHIKQAQLQLTREPRALPKLILKRKPDSIFDYQFEDFEVVGYDPHPHIAAPVAV
jgi:thymidylate synthase